MMRNCSAPLVHLQRSAVLCPAHTHFIQRCSQQTAPIITENFKPSGEFYRYGNICTLHNAVNPLRQIALCCSIATARLRSVAAQLATTASFPFPATIPNRGRHQYLRFARVTRIAISVKIIFKLRKFFHNRRLTLTVHRHFTEHTNFKQFSVVQKLRQAQIQPLQSASGIDCSFLSGRTPILPLFLLDYRLKRNGKKLPQRDATASFQTGRSGTVCG